MAIKVALFSINGYKTPMHIQIYKKTIDSLLNPFFLNFKLIVCELLVLIDFSLTVKAAPLILISGRGSAISSGKSGFKDNLVKS